MTSKDTAVRRLKAMLPRCKDPKMQPLSCDCGCSRDEKVLSKHFYPLARVLPGADSKGLVYRPVVWASVWAVDCGTWGPVRAATITAEDGRYDLSSFTQAKHYDFIITEGSHVQYLCSEGKR